MSRSTMWGGALLACLIVACGDSRRADDAGSIDAGTPTRDDAGTTDAGIRDAGTTDAGAVDAGSSDGGPVEGCDAPLEPVDPVVEDVLTLSDGVTHVDVAVGCDGEPWVAVAGAGVHVVRRSPDGTWTTVEVDDPWISDAVSIAMGPDDRPQIGYGLDPEGLGWAGWDGSAWTLEVADPFVEIDDVHATVGPDGTPYLAFGTAPDHGSVVALREGDTWRSVALTSESSTDFPRVALDPSGGVHAAFQRFASPRRVVHGMLEGSSFSLTDIDHEARDTRGPWLGGWLSFAIDASGVQHFVYEADDGAFSPAYVALRHARREGDAIAYEDVTTGLSVTGTDMALGPDGHPRVAFFARPASSLSTVTSVRLARYDGASWAVRSLADDVEWLDRIGLAVDRRGTAHVVYSYGTRVEYARVP